MAAVVLGLSSGLFWGLADGRLSGSEVLGAVVLVLAYWAFFYLDSRWGAVRFTVALLGLWGAASILGTLFPQFPGQPRDVIQTDVLRLYARRYGELAAPLLISARFYDVFGSPWYRTILAMVGLEVLLCMWQRAGAALRRMRAPAVAVELATLRQMDNCFGANLPLAPEEAVQRLKRHFRRLRYGVLEQKNGNATDLYARRGASAIIGPLVTHVALLVIFVGAVYGGSPLFGGFESRIAPMEGGWAHEPHSDIYVYLERFEVPQDPRGMEIDYCSYVTFYEPTTGRGDAEVELVRLSELEEQTGAPHPIEEIIELKPRRAPRPAGLPRGKKVALRKIKRAEIRVNEPASVRGVGFYQSDWGLWSVTLRIAGAGESAEREVRILRMGEQLALEPAPLSAKFGELPEVVVWPAAIHVVPGGEPDESGNLRPWPHVSFVGLNRGKEGAELEELGTATIGEPVNFAGYELSVVGLRKFSGLRATRDPGVVLVFLGFAVLSLGLVLSFYVPLRVFRCKVLQRGQGSQVIIAAPRRTGSEVAQRVARAVLDELAQGATR